MFKFEDLDTMGRAIMLLKQQEAKREYQSVYKLRAMWDSFGADAKRLIDFHAFFANDPTLKKDMQTMLTHAGKKGHNITVYLEKLDAYLRDIDARLSDGTKWYTAGDIARMNADSQK